MSQVTVKEEWVLGPDNTPFYTQTWSQSGETPKACILFVHGFAEHIARYDAFFRRLAAPPSSLHITAFDQRGHGRTAFTALTGDSPEVSKWKAEGKSVNLVKHGKRRTGGWAKALPDIEWFVRRESVKANEMGKKLFLHGFSMGGGQVLAFATRPTAPPSAESLKLLSGVIAGGPLIKQTKPASIFQVKAGSFAANLGLGNMLIPTPMDYNELSHNQAANDKCKADPFCEQSGSLRGVADMLQGGATLDTQEAWNAWPKDLPLLVYHGGEDAICDPQAAQRFGQNAAAADKTFESIPGMYHEVHNELDPVPANLAKIVTDWVHARAGATSSGSATAEGVQPDTSAKL
ncbi:hypothetical protein IAU60_004123 [Kwoniella sp. DSM 27419]